MTDYLLNVPFQTSGEWYLPENPERRIHGILSYSVEHTKLQLDESFYPIEGMLGSSSTLKTYPVIHGISSDGDAMTLLDAQQVAFSLNIRSSGFKNKETVISPLLLIGAKISVDHSFKEMNFRLPGLQAWLSIPVIKESMDNDPSNGNRVLTFRIHSISEQSIHIRSINSNVDWFSSWHSSHNPFKSIDFSVSAWVTFRPDTPQKIAWYFDQLDKLATVLSFLAGTPMAPDFIETPFGDSHNKIYIMATFYDVKCCSFCSPHEFFMPRVAIGKELSHVINRWYEVSTKVYAPSQLARSVLGSETLWPHVEFLSLMQALEGFHRALYDGNYMTKEKYEDARKALGDSILPTLSPDHISALKSRIKYGYQYSLRKRLDKLADSLPEQIRRKILGNDGIIPSSWIDTRNYYTHWDEEDESRKNVLDGKEMYEALVRMRIFLQVLYLQLMGVEEKAILSAFGNASRASQRLVQANASEKVRKNVEQGS